MNWYILIVTVFFKIIEGLFAWQNGTLMPSSPGRPIISFISHGGTWGDFMIIPVVNALIWPHLCGSLQKVVFIFLASLMMMILLHVIWGSDLETTGHMWPSHPTGSWLRDLSIAGWVHVAYTTATFTILLIYATSPTPVRTAWIVGVLMMIFWCFAVVQPGYVITGRIFDLQATLTSVAFLGATWGVTLWKVSR